MRKIERSIAINVTVEKVFSYISNPKKYLEWIPGMVDIRDIEGEGVGQRFGWTYKMMGIPFKGETKCTDCIPNERIVIETIGGINSAWTFTFEPQGGRTLTNLVIEYSIPVPVLGKVGERLILRQNEREADLAMTNMKGRLEYREQFKTYRPESINRRHSD